MTHAEDRLSPGEALATAARAARDAAVASECEAGFAILTAAARDLLGDRNGAARPGALKPGERDYRVSGVFLVAPDRRHNVLTAGQGFPPEQRRLSIPIGWAHPGHVVRTEAPLLLENTDSHAEFRQFLKTSRMGSSLYMPVFDGRALIGQIVAAAQARDSFDAADLGPMRLLAAAAGLVWQATGGARWWAADHPADDAWYAEDEGAGA
jgi:putative methionine-R-sulfoxide reductase with GAF domain